MLTRLHVKNFKLLRDVELELVKGVPTVLIGPNASGKSTVIEVLDFLSRCATDGLEQAVVAHGGMNAIQTAGAEAPIEITSTWRFHTDPGDKAQRLWELEWSLSLDSVPPGQVVIRAESLRHGDLRLVDTTDDGTRVVLDELAPETTKKKTKTHARLSVPRTLAFQALVDEARYPALFNLREVVGQIRVLGAMASGPSWARTTKERVSARDAVVISTQSVVGREGLGLANALFNLQTDHHEAWDRLQRAFCAEFPFTTRIVFPPDPGGSRISFAIDDTRFPGRRIHASEMSDGMIVYLCLLSLILHPYEGAVLALDEPDAHLHPSAVRRLMGLAYDKHAGHFLLIVTHSNALLDELRDPAASIRIVEPTKDGARVSKLDPDALAAWRTEYTLSELRRTGHLDRSNAAGADE